jgi:hypothetical protein
MFARTHDVIFARRNLHAQSNTAPVVPFLARESTLITVPSLRRELLAP